jgi:multiple sugar transport system permease protein
MIMKMMTMKLRKFLLILTPVLILIFCISGRASAAKTKLVVWGPIFMDRLQGWEAAFHKFEKAHPGVEIRMLSMNVGGMSAQKLMTAIVGNSPPDVILQGRHTIADWASRDTFMPLDDFIARDRNTPGGLKPEEYYPIAWAETLYKGKNYAIPNDVDDRILYYNKALFRKAGLDPNRPPRTWDELMEYAKKLTVMDSQGNFKQIGFMPNFGNSWLYLYSWQNGGEFMSPDGRKCTMNNPESVESLKYMVSVYDSLRGVDAINSFSSGFKANELDPFLTGNSLADVSAEDVQTDYILLSHAHGDHLGDTVPIAKRTGATVISNFEIANYPYHRRRPNRSTRFS